ncbi:rarD protein [Vibrio ishigakensis]|uniref:RarD protein n=1 Tax=Vibrio ishigakensis TaxID=1481914 RepID=A0A0B8Q3F9_9VIBR|nr:rarD protein [Vibrio ishigakensis]
MFTAVAVYAVSEGVLPLMSLAIASAFALYIAVKKLSRLNTFTGLLLEHVLFAPIALFLILNNLHSVSEVTLLAGTAPLQLVSVLLLSISVTKVALSRVSLFQYIEPTIHFVLAMWVFREAISGGQMTALAIILIAIAISMQKPKLA